MPLKTEAIHVVSEDKLETKGREILPWAEKENKYWFKFAPSEIEGTAHTQVLKNLHKELLVSRAGLPIADTVNIATLVSEK